MTDEYFDSLLKRGLEENLRRELLGLYDGEPDTSALDRRMEKLLRAPTAYVKKAARPWYQKALRAAAMFLLVCSVLVGLSALNPQVRAKYSDLIKTLFTDHNTYKIESDVQTIFPQKVKLGYIPEGYELVNEIYDVNGVVVIYQDDKNETLLIEFLGKDGKLFIDNEHYDVYTITIENNAVDIYEDNQESGGFNCLVAYIEEDEFIISIDGPVAVNELIEIYKHIKY